MQGLLQQLRSELFVPSSSTCVKWINFLSFRACLQFRPFRYFCLLLLMTLLYDSTKTVAVPFHHSNNSIPFRNTGKKTPLYEGVTDTFEGRL
ncbi:hypothetical protein BCR42DRAFT_153515 [Absidia repens]|uniref:Uncharacterized protein n=1 Tax=Absidia repens TaxID=90262 RepID=A0A1X2I1X8_9FUNG|nr:hypothetical protein BCR42DRAFT_153515 [Absidia repens]